MIKLDSRYYKALAVAVGLHIAAAGALGFYAWLPNTHKDNIIEVSLAGAPKKKGVPKPAAVKKEKPKPKPVKIKTKKDDIIEKKLEEKQEEEIPATPETPEETTNEDTINSGETGEQGATDGVEGGAENGNGGNEGNEGVAVQLPYVTYKVDPAYPAAARKEGVKGTVHLKVLINVNGRAIDAQVVGSSGHSALDQSALNAIYKWRFSPAKDAKGQKVRCYVNIPVIFKLR